MNATEVKALEDKAIATLKAASTQMLCEIFEGTNDNNDPAVPTVRGWVMDVLEARNPEAFEAWIDCEAVDLIDKPSHFFL